MYFSCMFSLQTNFLSNSQRFCISLDFASWENEKGTMAEGEQRVELKFRIYDGTDIGHSTYAPSTSVATLKQRLVAEWPQDKTITPKSVNDVKLIHAGKVLENNKTLADSRVTMGDLPNGVITMHVVIQPPLAKKKRDKNHEEMQKQNSCSCTIL
ncbi:membrane-anchored ubiquitin-fold protein 3-like [Pistacia vera]|uniref:membrane-anchored ubiquitin-fold protein 3-like n=1 Tax=Pistacia vera TaxID=55513 RepID=UPI001262C435|nr:membrane-anchored ubiquitin-fold protein 3-like [Pistacia vera]